MNTKEVGTRRKRWRQALISRRAPVATLYPSEPLERINLVREGVPAYAVEVISEEMAISKEKLYATLGLPRATINRKLRAKQLLNQDESERVLGIWRLVGQVDTIVKQSGNPADFDAAKWVARWLDRPHPALGGRRPGELMDTAEGRTLVSDLIARMESAAYA